MESTSRHGQKIKRQRQVAIANRYKQFCGCALCGYKLHPSALEFHHLVPEEKEYTISRYMHGTWWRIKKEIRKCVVLCSNCHVIVETEAKYANS